MRSLIAKRSIVIGGHKTSISLEDAFWNELKMIAGEREMNLSELVSSIDQSREHGNLSSAIRLFVLDHYRAQAGGGAGVQENEAHPSSGGSRPVMSTLHAE